MPPVTVRPSKGVSMGLGPLVIFNNAHLNHGHKCPHVPISTEGTWQGHGSTGGKAPLPPGEGAGAWEGAGMQLGARIHPLPVNGHPAAAGVDLHSVNFLKVFGEKLAVAGAEPNLLKPEGMDSGRAGDVLGMTSTCHPGGLQACWEWRHLPGQEV